MTRRYDPAAVRLDYPNADVAAAWMSWRARRTHGIDLQARLHQDKRANARAYPARWQQQPADAHIDHRRVPSQMT